MADFQAPKWPDSFQQHEKPAIIKTAESLWVWPKTWKAIFDTKKWVANILIAGETKKETGELNEAFKKSFIEKLKKLPDYQWSKVQEAIEKWTIEIKKIPNRNWYAIYESKTWNLVYITKLDWATYTNVDYFRQKEYYEDWIIAWYIRQWYWKIELNQKTWLWELYKKNWEKIPIFSDEYTIATLNAINTMWEIDDFFENEIKKRKKEL